MGPLRCLLILLASSLLAAIVASRSPLQDIPLRLQSLVKSFDTYYAGLPFGQLQDQQEPQQQSYQQPQRKHQLLRGQRQLLLLPWQEPTKGTITVDVHRTYQDVTYFWFFTFRQHSIPLWRIPVEIESLNQWYNGRIRFVLGNVHETSKYNVVGDPCKPIQEFSESLQMENKATDRISIVISKKFDSSYFGCASGINVPLKNSPAVIIAMSNSLLGLDNHMLGLNTFLGGSLAHELGHIFGFEHTANDWYGVNQYDQCQLELRYPYYSRNSNDRSAVVEDSVSGATFPYNEWQGRSNVMAPFGFETHLMSPLTVGLFQFKYADIFDQILDCWFQQSSKVPLK